MSTGRLCLILRREGWIFSSGFSGPIVWLGGAVGFRIESKIGRLTVFFLEPEAISLVYQTPDRPMGLGFGDWGSGSV